MSDVAVSVCMVTYNHENYIEKAIRGVLEQQTNFDFELIIADDCSTDQTQERIEHCIKTLDKKGRIRYHRQEKNKGMMPNFTFALSKCSGKYLALCDGDDYWTSAIKLQEQFDFMESNPEAVACFHNSDIINEAEEVIGTFCYDRNSQEVSLEEIIRLGGSSYATSSFFTKNFPSFQHINQDFTAGDTPLIYELIDKGRFYYLDKNYAIYRKHNAGLFTSFSIDKERLRKGYLGNIDMLYYYRKKYPQLENYFQEAVIHQLHWIRFYLGFGTVSKLLYAKKITRMDYLKFIPRNIRKIIARIIYKKGIKNVCIVLAAGGQLLVESI